MSGAKKRPPLAKRDDVNSTYDNIEVKKKL